MSDTASRPLHDRRVEGRGQRGVFVIEALIAIVVVSIASAGLYLLVANALRTSSEALLRAEASELAAATIARMSAENAAALADRYDALANAPGFAALAAAASRLPGVTASTNLPAVAVADGPSAGTRSVIVTVRWQLPNRPAHRASMRAIVGP